MAHEGGQVKQRTARHAQTSSGGRHLPARLSSHVPQSINHQQLKINRRGERRALWVVRLELHGVVLAVGQVAQFPAHELEVRSVPGLVHLLTGGAAVLAPGLGHHPQRRISRPQFVFLNVNRLRMVMQNPRGVGSVLAEA